MWNEEGYVGNIHALFVDDEEELVSTLVERLGYRGIDADYATTGNGALEKMRANPYDIVVIDLKLPGMSGRELIGIVKKSFPELPIIMITGHGSGEADDYDHPKGVHAFLQKPIDISILINNMKDAIETNGSK